VKAGQVLGVQDVSNLVTSTAANPQALANAGGFVIANAEIKSPIDGKVVESDVINGQVVSPATEVATIADTAHIYIQANVEETSILRIKQGQAVDVWIDAYPHRQFQGYVESIGQATQTAFSPLPNLNTSGTYSKVTQLISVKIDVTDAGNLDLMLGMNAEVKIHVK
jgi:multidrug resistance efflux pump